MQNATPELTAVDEAVIAFVMAAPPKMPPPNHRPPEAAPVGEREFPFFHERDGMMVVAIDHLDQFEAAVARLADFKDEDPLNLAVLFAKSDLAQTIAEESRNLLGDHAIAFRVSPQQAGLTEAAATFVRRSDERLSLAVSRLDAFRHTLA